jgi:hypothetical protein
VVGEGADTYNAAEYKKLLEQMYADALGIFVSAVEMTEATPNYIGGKLTTVSTVTNVGPGGVTFSALESAVDSMGTRQAQLMDPPADYPASSKEMSEDPVDISAPSVLMASAQDTGVKTTGEATALDANLLTALAIGLLAALVGVATVSKRRLYATSDIVLQTAASADVVSIEIQSQAQPIRPQQEAPVAHTVALARRAYDDSLI